MGIVSFWGLQHGYGVTSSAAAVASLIGMEYQIRTLVSQPQFSDSTMERIFSKAIKSQNPEFFSITGSGLDALERAVRSGKMERDSVKNNALIVEPDRLDILKGTDKTDKIQFEDSNEIINIAYKKATEYYDTVILDLHSGTNSSVIHGLLEISDLIVVCVNQNINILERFFLNRENLPPALKKKPYVLLISQYDKDSKYKVKNICNKFRYKGPVFTVPYNTSFKDHINDGDISRFFKKNQEMKQLHPNRYFIEEVRKLSKHILTEVGVNTQVKQIQSGRGA
ncbi:hypothetical protein [Brevibacillus reuszeri]|uniref:hypothetical protein n=1 Tax=Brevibacillus reuszeri TaxID=54915 RepID=UPI000CCC39C0|nr:hypothetical protein [Brevibacillus reuszeri]